MSWGIKTGFILIFIGLASSIFAQELYFNVTNSNGAILRQTPYHKSNEIIKIPYGRQVRLIQDSVAIVNTKKTNGIVIKISYFGQTGYGLSTDFNYQATGINLSKKINAVKIEKNQTVERLKKDIKISNSNSINTSSKTRQPQKRILMNQGTYVQITSKKGLNVRSSENPNSRKIGTLAYKQQIQVIAEVSSAFKLAGKTGKMLEINFNGQTGYIFSGFTKTLKASKVKLEEGIDLESIKQTHSGDTLYLAEINSNKNLNIRSNSNPNSKVITSIAPGSVIAVIGDNPKIINVGGRSGKMVKIRYNEIIGYVFSPYIKPYKKQEETKDDELKKKVEIVALDGDTIYQIIILPKKGLNLRATAEPKSKVLLTIPSNEIIPVYNVNGRTIKIAGKKGQMLRVSYKNKSGYVFSGFTKAYNPIDPKSLDTLYLVNTTVNGLNLRSTQELNSTIIKVLKKNTQVAVIREEKTLTIGDESGKMLMVYDGVDVGYIFSGFTQAIKINAAIENKEKRKEKTKQEQLDTLYKVQITSSKGLNLRKNANKNSKIIGFVKPLSIVPVFEQNKVELNIGGRKGSMILIQYQGQTGYIFSGYTNEYKDIKLQDLEALYEVKIKTSKSLNMRAGDYSNAAVINQIPSGKIVKVIDDNGPIIRTAGREGKMIQVIYKEQIGYIFSGLVQKIKKPLTQAQINQKVEDIREFEKLQEVQSNQTILTEEKQDTSFLAQVTVSALNMRSSASSKSSVIGAVKKGEVIAVLDKMFDPSNLGMPNGRMIKVSLNNKTGYVSSIYIKQYEPLDLSKYEIKYQAIVKADNNLNMRVSQEKQSTVIQSLAPGTKLLVIDNTQDSIKIGNRKGKMLKVIAGNEIGYVFSSFTKEIEGSRTKSKPAEVKVESPKNKGFTISEQIDMAIELTQSIKEKTDAKKKGIITTKNEEAIQDQLPKISYKIQSTDSTVRENTVEIIKQDSIVSITKQDTSQTATKQDTSSTQTHQKDTLLSTNLKDTTKLKDSLSNSIEELTKDTDTLELEVSVTNIKKDTTHIEKDTFKSEEKTDTLDLINDLIELGDNNIPDTSNQVKIKSPKDIAIIEETPSKKEEEIKVPEIEKIDTLYTVKVISHSKLNMRSSADPFSNVINRLPSLSDVAVIEESKDKFKLKGKIGNMLKVYDGSQMGYIFSPYVRKHEDLIYNIKNFDTIYLARIASQNNLNLRITNDPSSAIIKALEPGADIAIINENSPVIKMGGRTGRMIQIYDGNDVGFVFSVFTRKIPKIEKEKVITDIEEEIPEYNSKKADPIASEEDINFEKFVADQRDQLNNLNELSLKTVKEDEPNKPATSKKDQIRPSLKNRIDDEIVEEMKLPYEQLHESLNNEFNDLDKELDKIVVKNNFHKTSHTNRYTTQKSIFLHEDANVNAKPIGKIKQGTQIKVLEKNIGPVIEHKGFIGRFLKVNINGYKGYVYEPFTAKIPVPEKETDLTEYKLDQFLDNNIKNDIQSYKVPNDYLQNEELLVLPCKDIRYAYLICQNIFNIPEALKIPLSIEGEQKIINNPAKNPDLLFDNIHIKMDETEIESITYNKKGFKVNTTIFIRMNYNHVRVHIIEENTN